MSFFSAQYRRHSDSSSYGKAGIAGELGGDGEDQQCIGRHAKIDAAPTMGNAWQPKLRDDVGDPFSRHPDNERGCSDTVRSHYIKLL
ncbi:MAG: hypothetical protein NVS4B3_15780 [Gemmatimonadaceae bacterium]